MTRAPDLTELGAVALTAAYNVVLNRHLPEATHLPANLGASGALLLLAHRAGVGADDLGLSPDAALSGVRLGALVAAGAAGVVAAGAALPLTRRFFVDDAVHDHSPAELTYHTLLRIPLATALGEELVFRAALLGLVGRDRSPAGRDRRDVGALRPVAHPAHARVARPGAGSDGTSGPDGPGRRGPRRRSWGSSRRPRVPGRVLGPAAPVAQVLAPTVAHAALNVAAMLTARVVSRPGPGRAGLRPACSAVGPSVPHSTAGRSVPSVTCRRCWAPATSSGRCSGPARWPRRGGVRLHARS